MNITDYNDDDIIFSISVDMKRVPVRIFAKFDSTTHTQHLIDGVCGNLFKLVYNTPEELEILIYDSYSNSNNFVSFFRDFHPTVTAFYTHDNGATYIAEITYYRQPYEETTHI